MTWPLSLDIPYKRGDGAKSLAGPNSGQVDACHDLMTADEPRPDLFALVFELLVHEGL